jgi:hypothetical protein
MVMRRYHFKLVDSRIVSDYGVHELIDDTIVRTEAIKLARSMRSARPELVEQHCLDIGYG